MTSQISPAAPDPDSAFIRPGDSAVGSNCRGRSVDAQADTDRQALDEWRSLQYGPELELLERFIREYRSHHGWASAHRAERHFTLQSLKALNHDFIELLYRHGYDPADAPPDARPIQIRMFYIPRDT
jgi:hypothetical protein